jgi:hypothetical protein
MGDAGQIELIVLRAEDSFAACVDYVMRLFARVHQWKVSFTDMRHAAAFMRSAARPRVVVHYSTGNTTVDSEEWEGDCEVFIRIQRSRFFGRRFLASPDLPVAAETLQTCISAEGFAESASHTGRRTVRLSFDLIAAAFWFLSRYEEYIINAPDDHGRFLAGHSLAPPELYDVPVVNHWFEHLAGIIRGKLGIEDDSSPRQTVALTHDVDLIRKYRGLRGARRAISSMAQSTVTDATDEMRVATLVLAGIRRDPYDSFDQLFSLKDRIGAPSTFFLMGGGRSPYDGDYDLDEMPVRELITRIRNNGDEIGVHPSYDSYRSEQMIRAECAAVAEAAGQQVSGSRQHYLRFALPETLRALAGAGLRYDTTLSFPDRAGFRCGWSGCFHPFDVERRVELPIIEIPLIAMDVTLSIYEKVAPEHAVERVARLLDASVVRGGAFVLLWHNTLRDGRVHGNYWDSLEYFAFAAAGHARFVTLSRLCDEFETTNSSF